MEKFTLYLGLNDKDTKKQEIPTTEAYRVVQSAIAQQFGGGTIYEAHGVYRHNDGAIVEEKTLRIELLMTVQEKVAVFAAWLKMRFNQESVVMQRESITSELI